MLYHISLCLIYHISTVAADNSNLHKSWPWIAAPFEAASFLVGHPWIPASQIQNSSRSPCPMLNTLANHGFLSRDGQNITTEDFNNAQVVALNFSPDLASTTTNAMVAKLGAPTNLSDTFSLGQFSSHDHTEHDASLTRLDVIQGDAVDVNYGLVQRLLDDATFPWLNTTSLGHSRVRREAESIAAGSPKLADRFVSFAQLEASFITLVFGVGGENDTDARGAPKDQVKAWLDEERFPIEKGYDRSATVLTSNLHDALTDGVKKYHDEFDS